MRRRQLAIMIIGALVVLGLTACDSSTESTPTTQVPAIFQKFQSTVTVSVDGTQVVLRLDLPGASPILRGTVAEIVRVRQMATSLMDCAARTARDVKHFGRIFRF